MKEGLTGKEDVTSVTPEPVKKETITNSEISARTKKETIVNSPFGAVHLKVELYSCPFDAISFRLADDCFNILPFRVYYLGC
jgi:hypothetical protein